MQKWDGEGSWLEPLLPFLSAAPSQTLEQVLALGAAPSLE